MKSPTKLPLFPLFPLFPPVLERSGRFDDRWKWLERKSSGSRESLYLVGTLGTMGTSDYSPVFSANFVFPPRFSLVGTVGTSSRLRSSLWVATRPLVLRATSRFHLPQLRRDDEDASHPYAGQTLVLGQVFAVARRQDLLVAEYTCSVSMFEPFADLVAERLGQH